MSDREVEDDHAKELERLTKCDHCNRPATCYGAYEGIKAFACDDCCGHGREDGYCHDLRGAIGMLEVRNAALEAYSVEARSVIETLLPYLHQVWGMETEDRFEARQEAKMERAEECLARINQAPTPAPQERRAK